MDWPRATAHATWCGSVGWMGGWVGRWVGGWVGGWVGWRVAAWRQGWISLHRGRPTHLEHVGVKRRRGELAGRGAVEGDKGAAPRVEAWAGGRAVAADGVGARHHGDHVYLVQPLARAAGAREAAAAAAAAAARWGRARACRGARARRVSARATRAGAGSARAQPAHAHAHAHACPAAHHALEDGEVAVLDDGGRAWQHGRVRPGRVRAPKRVPDVDAAARALVDCGLGANGDDVC